MYSDPTKIIQPSWFVGGFEIGEPITTLTDWMIAAICFYAFWRLGKSDQKGPTFTFFRVFFFLTGVGTFCGGLFGHMLIHVVDPQLKLIGFYTGMFAVAAIERSAMFHAGRFMKPVVGKIFLVINILELLFMLTFTAITLHFKYVEYHLAYGFLIVVFFFHLFAYRRSGDKGSLLMLWNTVLLIMMVIVFNYPIIIHDFFNHRDLAHVLMMISIWVMLRASLRMGKNVKEVEVQEG